ncbi:carboxypeptidase-like regulatory domain-containing protein [Pedobacter sp. L105]|uniref:carboxypeptidase-like regulatory domain-containing protein n=1 Tax=Pedobacter sp. L105 TaxID=1641871 RepID=UPI00131D7CEA|nr:carboxypeptidase-like regulatory domain-containing protein [Pedobacter sp. L105]
MKKLKHLILILPLMCTHYFSKAQYVQPEKKIDTIKLMPQTTFDIAKAKSALAPGKATIKGVAFTKPKTKFGYNAPFGPRIYANKIKVLLFPVTPYLLEYLDLRKQVNYKKLKFAYMSNEAWNIHYYAITNSEGQFTFPNLKPGKYYVEGLLNWTSTGSYNQYTGSGYGSYGGRVDYYDRKYYDVAHADLLNTIVEIKDNDEVLEMKLK